MSQKYVVVHFLKPQKVGFNFPSSAWPPHVTLLPLFTLTRPIEEFIVALKKAAQTMTPFNATAEAEAQFGPRHNVHVMILKRDAAMVNLHSKLLEATDGMLVFDTPEYTGNGFKPHITIQKDNEVPRPLQSYYIADLTIVDMFPGQDITRRAVVETYPLEGQLETI